VRVELRVAGEQLGTARAAAVDADRLGVGVLAGERALCAGLTQDVVLLRAQLGAPLVLALLDGVVAASGAAVGGLALLEHASTVRRPAAVVRDGSPG